MEHYLDVYYTTTFCLNGKFQFDWYYYALQKSSKHLYLDQFVQFVKNNVYIYIGPKQETRGVIEANVRILQNTEASYSEDIAGSVYDLLQLS